jgi:hypothetical protein
MARLRVRVRFGARQGKADKNIMKQSSPRQDKTRVRVRFGKKITRQSIIRQEKTRARVRVRYRVEVKPLRWSLHKSANVRSTLEYGVRVRVRVKG